MNPTAQAVRSIECLQHADAVHKAVRRDAGLAYAPTYQHTDQVLVSRRPNGCAHRVVFMARPFQDQLVQSSNCIPETASITFYDAVVVLSTYDVQAACLDATSEG
jgi:hypothetical protein